MNKITYMLAGASMLAVTGIVSAEPVALSADQMDGVNAGAVTIYLGAAEAAALAGAIGNDTAATKTITAVAVDPNGTHIVAAGAQGTSAAVSSYNPTATNNGAAAASAAGSLASLI
jgi:hypothetical protein